ncbi:hypothetical protein ACWDZ6_17885 [Streptomyces sp. NPDC002926]
MPGGGVRAAAHVEYGKRFQAEYLSTQRLHNGGSNYVARQVVVVASGMPQKSRFLAHLCGAVRCPAASRLSGQ